MATSGSGIDPFGGQDPFGSGGATMTTSGSKESVDGGGGADPFANFADFGSAKVSVDKNYNLILCVACRVVKQVTDLVNRVINFLQF